MKRYLQLNRSQNTQDYRTLIEGSAQRCLVSVFFTGYVTEFVNVNVLTWLNEIVFLVEKELHDILHGEFPYAKIGLGGKGLQIYNLNSIFRHFDFRNH